MTTVSAILHSPEQAHKLISSVAWPRIKAELAAGRDQVLMVEPYEDHLTIKQRGYYHGVVLTEIARQASVEGRKYPMAIWKEYFRQKFLGDKRKTYIDPFTGRKSRRRVRVSTEDLGVKKYAKLIDEVIGFAIVELDVRFPAGSWETYEP